MASVEGDCVIVEAAQGYVLTNGHVVENATSIEVTTKDNRRLPAKLIGRDADTDVAVLQIAPHSLTAIPMGDSDKLHGLNLGGQRKIAGAVRCTLHPGHLR